MNSKLLIKELDLLQKQVKLQLESEKCLSANNSHQIDFKAKQLGSEETTSGLKNVSIVLITYIHSN